MKHEIDPTHQTQQEAAKPVASLQACRETQSDAARRYRPQHVQNSDRKHSPMIRTLATAAAITLAAITTAQAGTLPDYSDKTHNCNKEDIEEELAAMIKESAAGIMRGARLLYIKGEPVEVSRKPDELRCQIEIKTTLPQSYPTTGIFRFHNADGHPLVGWQPNKRKSL
jgi:hypothetical protein